MYPFLNPYYTTTSHHRYSHGVLAIDEDLAKDKDKIRNTEMVKMMLGDHPDWVEAAGVAYDAQSTMFSSHFLDFSSALHLHSDGFLSMDDKGCPVYHYNVRQSPTKDPFCQVLLSETGGIQVPSSIDGTSR